MTSELARRIVITIGALLIFRFGSHIPLAGISMRAELFSAGAIARLSVLSLSLVPYISAAIIIQLVSIVWGRVGALERSGESGRRKIGRATLMLTLLLATFQSFGIASGIQGIPGLVTEPGGWFLLSTTATLVGGVFFLVWLSQQITRHGIGNGIALILFAGVVVALPGEVAGTIELVRQGGISANVALLAGVVATAMVIVVVLVERARRDVPVQFAARQVGNRLLPPRSRVLPIKLNSAGFLIPSTVTPWIFYLPLVLATFTFGQTPWLATAFGHVSFGRPAHMIIGAVAVFVLAFVYTACVLDPGRAAETLREQGGTIADVAPGEPAAAYLDRTVTLTTVIGAIYLVAISVIPEALVAYGELPYFFGGGSALIVVCTILDIETQVRGYSLTGSGGEAP